MKQEISGVLLSGPSTQSTRGAILPSSGVWSLLDKLVLTNKSRLRQVLDSVVVFLLLYTATVSPFQLAFWDFRVFSETDAGDWTNPLRHPFWSAVDAVVEALFVMDLLLQFICSYTEKDIEVVSSKLICWNYVSGYFIIDAMGCLPAQAFTSLFNLVQTADTTSSTSPAKIVRLSRLTRAQKLSRVVRLSRLMRLLKFTKFKCWNDHFAQNKMIQFTVLLFVLLITLHVMACGMYLCAALHIDIELTWIVRRPLLYTGTNLLDATPWTCWTHSMYFVMTVFTTVGFGDISAFTIGEMAYVSLIMLVGMVINSMIVGEILSVINGMDYKAAKIAQLQEAVDQFAEVTGLDEQAVQRFKTAVTQSAPTEKVNESAAMQRVLKGHLGSDLLKFLADSVFDGMLKRNRFILAAARNFDFVPPRLPLLAATLLTRKLFGKDTPVYMAGELALGIYLVLKGTFAHMRAGCPYHLCSFDNYFGDFEVFTRLDLRTSEVRSQSTFGETLYLASDDLTQLSQQFPSMEQMWRGDAKRRFARAKISKKEINLDVMLDVKGLAVSRIKRWWRQLPRNQSGKVDNVSGSRSLATAISQTTHKEHDRRAVDAINGRDMDRIANCEQAVRTLNRDVNERLARCEHALSRILSCLEKAGLSEGMQDSSRFSI
eukprot:TRINITY_DN25069_c0_g1_i2.p1 TRINITY_DN25069_c0_g1~~TRINITY_DN25069_c0_g1_i2.p1  ORF type:complete len:657 (+),score=91.29 TRINITY_DN25069_c0_g1_i2:23-1993(+)